MVNIFKKTETSPLDIQIAAVLAEMERVGVTSPEYPALMVTLNSLYNLKTSNRRVGVSKDTVAIIAGNLAGILLIVAYEQKHVLNSKGWANVLRPKSNQAT